MSFFRTPKSSPFCGVCGGAWPDGHYADCPVLTGEAQTGQQIPSSLTQQLAQQAAQGLMGQGLTSMVEFVGGPLDGENPVHPLQNYILTVQGDTSGYYQFLGDGRYHWVTENK